MHDNSQWFTYLETDSTFYSSATNSIAQTRAVVDSSFLLNGIDALENKSNCKSEESEFEADHFMVVGLESLLVLLIKPQLHLIGEAVYKNQWPCEMQIIMNLAPCFVGIPNF